LSSLCLSRSRSSLLCESLSRRDDEEDEVEEDFFDGEMLRELGDDEEGEEEDGEDEEGEEEDEEETLVGFVAVPL
jgi:hypothetical protein